MKINIDTSEAKFLGIEKVSLMALLDYLRQTQGDSKSLLINDFLYWRVDLDHASRELSLFRMSPTTVIRAMRSLHTYGAILYEHENGPCFKLPLGKPIIKKRHWGFRMFSFR